MSAQHTLRARVGTVHRGVFDSTIAPVLTIASGDVVEITTLSGNPDQMPPPALGFGVLPEHRDVLARVPAGEGPHLLTGPIAVEGAMPGDELIVEVLDMKLAQDWGWNRFAPGMGALPEQFPDARCIHIAIDRVAGTVTLPWGLTLKAAPFFGIIGVAPPPAMGRANSIVPRAFGGNIDNKHFGAGAIVHLPVFNPGGLLSVGDGHAFRATAKCASPRSRRRSPVRCASRLPRIPALRGPGRRRQAMSSPWRSIPTSTLRQHPPCAR
jgi:acetamidase/formamidase